MNVSPKDDKRGAYAQKRTPDFDKEDVRPIALQTNGGSILSAYITQVTAVGLRHIKISAGCLDG
jgi:hypothetical protein